MNKNQEINKDKIKILSIETSCDETAVSIIEATGGPDNPIFEVLGNALYSQIDIHAEYGGVFPMLAKREHGKNLIPLLEKAVTETLGMNTSDKIETEKTISKNNSNSVIDDEKRNLIVEILNREEGLSENLLSYLKENINKLLTIDLDYIAVTQGPGLEPALWVGISFAKALSIALNKPLIPINHMEGHIVSVLVDENKKISFPALALLISGGHTELVECINWNEYKIIGQTVDDAIGEAFDKTARLIGIPYPGGPKISQMAGISRLENLTKKYIDENGVVPWSLPRPMLHSKDFNFSFSGIKTAVLYAVRNKLSDKSELSDIEKMTLAEEFENAVTEVIIYKTKKALEKSHAKTLLVGGGVIANKYIRSELAKMISESCPDIALHIPTLDMTTDNSVMIGVAGYLKSLSSPESVLAPSDLESIKNLNAKGGLVLGI